MKNVSNGLISDRFWQNIQPVYEDILRHPFIQQLQQGDLPQTIFNYYLQQDALYLADYARVLAIAGTKTDDRDDFWLCLSFAKEAVSAEITLHKELLGTFNQRSEKSLSCLAYTQFLLATAANATFAETLAALLPCFWIYREVGYFLKAHSAHANPYQLWIDNYSSREFNTSVEQAIAMLNRASLHASKKELKNMEHYFMTSARLELAFWDEAYRCLPENNVAIFT